MINQGQHAELHRLLEHAWDHSPFYRERYESEGIRRNDLAGISIQHVPLISKDTLVRFLDDLIVVHSSGSSGRVALFAYNDKPWRVADIAVASRLPYAPRR